MKLAIVAPSYKRWIGRGRRLTELARRWVGKVDMHVFAIEAENLPPQVTFHRVPVPFKRWSLKNLCFFFLSAREVRKERFDIVDVWWPSALAADVATCTGLLARPVSVWRREMGNPHGLGIPKRLAMRYGMMAPVLDYNYAAGNYQKIVALSENVKQLLIQFYNAREEDISVILNGVDLEEFNPNHLISYRKEVREKLHIEESDFVFLFVGHIFRNKGLGFLLEALNRIGRKDVRLIVVGEDRHDKDFFIKKIEQLGLRKRVFLAGRVTSGINRYYAASDTLVFPSIYESFGMVVLEAMASGLPVITTRLVGASCLVKEGSNGFLVDFPWDIDALAEKMRIVVTGAKGLNEALSVESRKTAESCSWDNTAEKLLQVYEQVKAR